MAQERLSVRRIREVLRLKFAENRSLREIGRAIGASPSVVHGCLDRFKSAGLAWPLDDELTDDELELRLYAHSPAPSLQKAQVQPDWAYVHRELKRRRVTLQLLWQEYRLAHPDDGYQYSRFCDLYREWAKPLKAVMHQDHKAGDKAFVDWSGDGIEVASATTGEISEYPLFVSALGASGLAFARAAESRRLPHWIQMHNAMFQYYGGVTAATVPDNEKSGVTSPCRYDPELNPTYRDWAMHYGTAVLPARKGKPRDKAMVENAVGNVQRWILAELRNHVFFSLEQANEAIAAKLEAYNARLLQRLKISRRELFEQIERDALKPLPAQPFEFCEWSRATVHIDYHVVVDKHHYSVPYRLIGKRVEARWTASTVEILYGGQRVACHARSYRPWGWTTIEEHRPQPHREHLKWTPERLIAWAHTIGAETSTLVEKILSSKQYPERGYRQCLGVLRLSQKYGVPRLEAACHRALALGSPTYRTVANTLKSGADQLELAIVAPTEAALPEHDNIRGPEYYN